MIMGFSSSFLFFSPMSPPVFSDIPHSGISFQNEGEVNSPRGGNCTSRTNALYLFSIHLSRNCQATALFSAIVHEPRLQNLSKKSIKSLLSETLSTGCAFRYARHSTHSAVWRWMPSEVSSFRRQSFFTVTASATFKYKPLRNALTLARPEGGSPPLSPGCLGKHGFHRGAHCVKVGFLLCVFYLLDGIRPEKSIQYGAVDKVTQQPSLYSKKIRLSGHRPGGHREVPAGGVPVRHPVGGGRSSGVSRPTSPCAGTWASTGCRITAPSRSCAGGSHRDCFLLKCSRCGRICHLDCSHLKALYDHLEQRPSFSH